MIFAIAFRAGLWLRRPVKRTQRTEPQDESLKRATLVETRNADDLACEERVYQFALVVSSRRTYSCR